MLVTNWIKGAEQEKESSMISRILIGVTEWLMRTFTGVRKLEGACLDILIL